MTRFEYSDDYISDKEILIAVPSIMIGVGILSVPKDLAEQTIGSDGWLPLAAGGVIVIAMTWLVARLAAKFPQQSFLAYSSKITSRPAGIAFTVLLSIQGIMLTAYETRIIANVADQYLFDRTPVEVVALAFLLVVVYAVSGSRTGLFRLNMMFLPIILAISLIVMVFTTGWFEPGNLLPVMRTDAAGFWNAMNQSTFSYIGFGILLFYTALVKNPKNVPWKASAGASIAVFLYILFYLICIGVFGNLVTANLQYPTVELAKEVKIPGGFFERFESLFFVIWIMAIFNTTTMAMDAAVFALNSIFKKDRKMPIIFLLAPLAYLMGMIPEDINEVSAFGTFTSYYGAAITVSITILLYMIAKLRGVKAND
ncbi:GerAB/ArcD/ProY family transporter [Lentibacillus jeotgali]|uniref:GerAB/ArcD/ProY family transporter n=1 Tax=Lentibacillus jeotgali TaxID=558169 RepID=UPI0002628F7E|nr:endospore germination permease [Lentibacillus jeotgali]